MSCTPNAETGAMDTCDQCMDTFMIKDLPTCDCKWAFNLESGMGIWKRDEEREDR
jgi:hypothetical protein